MRKIMDDFDKFKVPIIMLIITSVMTFVGNSLVIQTEVRNAKDKIEELRVVANQLRIESVDMKIEMAVIKTKLQEHIK